MFRTVELPLWLLLLILLFAVVTFASHFLFPSVRWFFRKRAERVVGRLNEKLERPIQPFKLARRHDMIQRLIYDPQIAQAIADHVGETGEPQDVAFERARRYAREIVPAFSASAYFGVAIRLAKWLSRLIYRVRLGHYDEDAIKAIDPDATVVFVMNHRSNMDYVLVTYLAAERSALSYAVGEWARIWPLRGLIKAMGAYFIRRRSRNTLYRRVLARYVQLATEGGVAQAMFPEGGLSLDGTVHEPRLGLLNYIVSDFNPDGPRDVVFIPVAINYDRVMEDRVLMAAHKRGDRRFGFSILKMLGFVWRQFRFLLSGRYHRFGYAAVSFGDPMSLRGFIAEQGTDTEAVGAALMERIRDVLPVLPVPLVATVLKRAKKPLSRPEIGDRVAALIGSLQDKSAYIHLPRDSTEYATKVGLRMLLLRRMAVETGERVSISEGQEASIDFYANSIAHLLHRRIS